MELEKAEELFAGRLAELRMAKGVSARDMSLSIGQSAGYINNIENQKNFPSMTVFFYICDYLGITPKQFFDFELSAPNELSAVIDDLSTLKKEQLDLIRALIREIRK